MSVHTAVWERFVIRAGRTEPKDPGKEKKSSPKNTSDLDAFQKVFTRTPSCAYTVVYSRLKKMNPRAWDLRTPLEPANICTELSQTMT